MGNCFITRRGGGTSKVYAAIGVSYPEGSTCTCTDGAKTLKLRNTSGRGIFLIPYAATWAVTAVSGSKSTSKTVSITTEGQVKTVTLTYELVLFDGKNGGDNTAVTGGWLTFYSSGASVNVSAEKITMDGGEGYPSAVATKNAVDLSEYSTLFMRYKVNSTRGGVNDELMFGVAASSDKILKPGPSFIASNSLKIETTSGVVDLSCDISSVNTGAVGVNARYVYNIDIFKIWLE